MRISRRRLGPAALLTVVLALTACSSDDGGDQPKDDAQHAAALALLDQGVQQFTAGETEAAEATFSQVLELDDAQPVAHYNLGLIAHRSGDERAAEKHYDAALDADDDYGPALYNKAILTENDDLDEAISLYRRAIEAQPEHAPSHMRLGFALVHQGKDGEAETYLQRGLALDPAMAKVEAPNYD